MHDALGEEGTHGAGQLAQEEADGVLAECALHDEVVGQVAAVAVLGGEKQNYLLYLF